MRPDRKSNHLLGVTRSKAKMIEYHVPEEYQEIDLSLHPNKLFTISIGLLGDLAATINRITTRMFRLPGAALGESRGPASCQGQLEGFLIVLPWPSRSITGNCDARRVPFRICRTVLGSAASKALL